MPSGDNTVNGCAILALLVILIDGSFHKALVKQFADSNRRIAILLKAEITTFDKSYRLSLQTNIFPKKLKR